MMKTALCIILLGSELFAQQMVGDFAPLAVNNCWVYDYTSTGIIPPKGSCQITITVQSKYTVGKDTVVILQVKQEGLSTLDSTMGEYADSVIIQEDSITKCSGIFGSWLNPVFTHHTISTDSLQNGVLGSDAVQYYQTESSTSMGTVANSGRKQQFVQNVGLYYCSGWSASVVSGASGLTTWEIKLLSMNNSTLQPLSVRSLPKVTRIAGKSVAACNIVSNHLYHKAYDVEDGFMLNGKHLKNTRVVSPFVLKHQ